MPEEQPPTSSEPKAIGKISYCKELLHLRSIQNMKIPEILRKDKTWTVVSAIASAIAAIAALLAITQTSSILESERELRRPYLTPYVAEMVKDDETDIFSFIVGLKNIGKNSLRDPEMKLLVKNNALDEDLFVKLFHFSSETPPGDTLSYRKTDIESSEIKHDSYYVLLAIRYEDPTLKRNFAQIFFYKWRTKLTKFERITIVERDEIMKDQGLELPFTYENISKQFWKNTKRRK